MPIEHWGSLSVADQNNTSALIAYVQLYDRLVMPIYTESCSRDERKCWEEKGWSPDVHAYELSIPDTRESNG